MKYQEFEPPTVDPPPGPSKEDIVRQIEADHYAATQAGDDAALEVLEERHAAVLAVKSDSAAQNAYVKAVEEYQAAVAAEAPVAEVPVEPVPAARKVRGRVE
jgi:hypothetical protein